MERRRRDWLKFGALVGLGIVLSAGFVSVIDFPENSQAQEPTTAAVKAAPPGSPAPQAAVAAESQPAPVAASAALSTLGDAFSAVAEAVRPTVVFIDAQTRSQPDDQGRVLPEPFDRFFRFPDNGGLRPRRGQGSGFVVSPDGYIITNNHVVEGFDRLEVHLFDRRRFTAKVVGRDPNTDIAVIKIDASSLPTVSFGDSDSLRVGEWVLAVGNPLGEEFSFTVTAGIVSGRGRGLAGLLSSEYSIQDFLQTDAAINPGNSGGPLVDIRGQVVGVNAAIASRTGYYSGYSFAIPINLARSVVDQLIETGHVTRAVLGVSIRNVEPEDAEYVGLDEIRGVVVQDFSADSPAREAGIRRGDVIVELDGQEVEYVAQLQQLVGFKKPGERVQVTVLRERGERRTLNVRLGEAAMDEETTLASRNRDEAGETASYEAKLGLQVENIDRAQLTQYRGVPSNLTGVIVTAVDPDGPARDKPMLQASNPRAGRLTVITHVDGQEVRSQSDLGRVLRDIGANEIVSLRVTLVFWNGTGQTRLNDGVVRLRVADIG
jgi:serine protease Do